MPTPNLVISVVGGTNNLSISKRTKKAFKTGLIKAASSGALIITGGTNTETTRLVGEAVAEERSKYADAELTVLGIATWGKIAMNDMLVNHNETLKKIEAYIEKVPKEAYKDIPTLNTLYDGLYNSLIRKSELYFYSPDKKKVHSFHLFINTHLILLSSVN